MNDYEQRRIAFHEAGHALVAHLEGFCSKGIIVRLKGGSASYSPRLPNASLAEYASSRLRVLLAGAVAQCMLTPYDKTCIKDACDRVDANDDWRKAQEVVTLIAHHRTMGLESNDLEMKRISDEIVAEYIEQIQAIIEHNRLLWSQLGMLVLRRFQTLFNHSPDDPDAPSELHIPPSELDPILSALERVATDGSSTTAVT